MNQKDRDKLDGVKGFIQEGYENGDPMIPNIECEWVIEKLEDLEKQNAGLKSWNNILIKKNKEDQERITELTEQIIAEREYNSKILGFNEDLEKQNAELKEAVNKLFEFVNAFWNNEDITGLEMDMLDEKYKHLIVGQDEK